MAPVRTALAAISLAGGLLAGLLLAEAPGPPNIVLVVMDAFRADRLGAARDGRELTPNLSRLAAEGVVYENAYCTAPQTKLSTASIFTGRHPSYTGVIDRQNTLPPQCTTLAEALRERGYRTLGIHTNAWIDAERQDGFVPRPRGFAAGFHKWQYLEGDVEDVRFYAGAAEVNEAAINAVKADIEPTFLYVHYMDTHEPYTGPEPRWTTGVFHNGASPPQDLHEADAALQELDWGAPDQIGEEQKRRRARLYDEAVLYLDGRVGRLVEKLRRRFDRDTVFIITADHGELLGEHGCWGHARELWEEAVRVPLIIVGPGLPAGRRVETRVSTVRLYEWIRALAEGKAAPALSPEPERLIIQMRTGEGDRVKVIRPDGAAVILRRSLDGEVLSAESYPLEQDPGEERPLPVPPSRVESVASVPEQLRRLADSA